MNLLRVAQELYPYVLGGGAYHAHALSRDQAAAGHDVQAVTVSGDCRGVERERRDGYEVCRFPAPVSLLGNDIAPRAFRHLWTTDGHDVVHAHAHFYAASNVAALKRQFSDTPLAVTNHSLISQSVPESVARLHLRTVGRFTFDAADVVFCYTDTEAERLRELGVSSRIEVVSNGVDHDRFTPDGPAYPPIRDTPGVAFVFVGRLVAGKRPGVLLDAIETAREEVPEATVHFVGDGDRRADLEAAVRRRELTDAVTFHGRVPYDRMPEVYRAADVVVLPSRSEGFPRTILEALSSGTPVVASALEQTESVVERAGRAVPVGDDGELGAAMAALGASPDRRERLGADARTLVVDEGLTWDRTVAETTAALEEVVGEH